MEFLKYLGPGILVTVGFIDPGNWATNIAAGSGFGYSLLWVLTLSTIMLIILQHNAAHLGIASGKCLSESTMEHLPPALGICILSTAMLANIATALAEILGGALALEMLFGLPITIGSVLVMLFVSYLLYFNAYKKLEKIIVGFVSLIGFAFLIEMLLVETNWKLAAISTFTPSIPPGSMIIIMGVLGAIVMPHNLFLHSKIIQSRQWNLEDDSVIKKQLKFEFIDTFFSMIIGFAINGAIIIVAAATFYSHGIYVDDIAQAQILLKPLLGDAGALVFAVAFLIAGVASSITAGMAGGTIFSGIFKKSYDIKDSKTKLGIGITFVFATILIFFISNPFNALIYSQMLLSVQLPITIFLQIYLTSSKKVMGKYANTMISKTVLITLGLIVSALNILLLMS